MSKPEKITSNRRRLIKTLGGAASVSIITQSWQSPFVHSVVLPSHAQLTSFNGTGNFGSGDVAALLGLNNPLLDALVKPAYARTTVDGLSVCINVLNLIATIEVFICGSSSDAKHKQTNVNLAAPLNDQVITYDSGYTGYGPGGSDELLMSGQLQPNGDSFEFSGSVQHFSGTTPFTAPLGGDCGPPGGEVCCFLAGTSVWMADGSYKPIENLIVGDLVASHDFTTGKRIVSPVTKLHRATAPDYLELNGLSVTGTHPFAVGEDQWQRAGQLQPGAVVYGGNGPVEVTRKRKVPQAIDVFNMRVEGTHNYYVSDGSETFLVHNKV